MCTSSKRFCKSGIDFAFEAAPVAAAPAVEPAADAAADDDDDDAVDVDAAELG